VQWCATYCWETLHKGYNISFEFLSIGGFHKQLWVSKVAKIPIERIFRTLDLGIARKMTFECRTMANHGEY
jgi:hypothetical protein